MLLCTLVDQFAVFDCLFPRSYDRHQARGLFCVSFVSLCRFSAVLAALKIFIGAGSSVRIFDASNQPVNTVPCKLLFSVFLFGFLLCVHCKFIHGLCSCYILSNATIVVCVVFRLPIYLCGTRFVALTCFVKCCACVLCSFCF